MTSPITSSVAREALEEVAAQAPMFMELGINTGAEVLALSFAIEELTRISGDPEFRLVGHSGISVKKVKERLGQLQKQLEELA